VTLPEHYLRRNPKLAVRAVKKILANSDNWCRPTTTKVSPDGALYVADMYRLMIEHPEWISPEMQGRVDLRAGSDRGRIYRVVPDGAKLRLIPNLAALDDHELAKAINSASGWQRDTVQRLLMELNGTDAAAELAQLFQPAYAPQVRVQALATLGVLGASPFQTTEPVLAKLGDDLSGIVTAETANSLVLRMPGGVDQAVLRTDIQSADPQTLSLMPTGFESGLPPQTMADLLAWLRGK
jgi:hypothetical protein